jgi:CubicO group peptidase (beta-lactamase class C family)
MNHLEVTRRRFQDMAQPLPARIDLDATFFRIDAMLEQATITNGLPGVALAVTDRTSTLAILTHGYATIDSKEAITAEALFEIGSIGKSFTAVVLLQLAAEGWIDLHAPVTTYLPWFAVRSEFAPITIHHLLTHTAGITGGFDHVPDPRFEVWKLRDTRAFAAPGKQFHYSNLGYKALGLVLEEILQQPYAAIIQERIFQPLGITRAWAKIVSEMRPRLATGYRPRFDDRPALLRHGLVPATWLESDTGDGCISMDAADLAVYLRALLNQGSGPEGTILTPDQFALMRHPHAGESPQPSYGYALVGSDDPTRDQFGHSGGMVGYTSRIVADAATGFGVVVLCNSLAPAVVEIATYALACLNATAAGDDLPEVPAPRDPFTIGNASEYAGMYRSDDRTIEIAADGESLVLIADDERIPLQRVTTSRDQDLFVADHPEFWLAPLRFLRSDPEPESDIPGDVREIIHGADWYRGSAYDGQAEFDYPPEWDAFVGHYRSHDPWFTNFRTGILKGELVAIGDGDPQVLVPDGDGFRIGKEQPNPDWVTFGPIVNGRALGCRFEIGAEFARFFTP